MKVKPIEVVRGWANYYRGAASSIVFAALDMHLWRLTYKWACHRHPHKPKPWIINRYFGRYNTDRQDRWVFGDRNSGAYLPKFAWTKIVRHGLVRGDASPDDPAQAGYWAERRSKSKPLLDRRTLHLPRRQNGSCPICGHLLLHADREPQSPREWEQWHRTTRKAIIRQHNIAHGTGQPDETRLVHSTCHRRITGEQQDPAPLHPLKSPQWLA